MPDVRKRWRRMPQHGGRSIVEAYGWTPDKIASRPGEFQKFREHMQVFQKIGLPMPTPGDDGGAAGFMRNVGQALQSTRALSKVAGAAGALGVPGAGAVGAVAGQLGMGHPRVDGAYYNTAFTKKQLGGGGEQKGYGRRRMQRGGLGYDNNLAAMPLSTIVSAQRMQEGRRYPIFHIQTDAPVSNESLSQYGGGPTRDMLESPQIASEFGIGFADSGGEMIIPSTAHQVSNPHFFDAPAPHTGVIPTRADLPGIGANNAYDAAWEMRYGNAPRTGDEKGLFHVPYAKEAALGALALGGLYGAYRGYKYYKNRKKQKGGTAVPWRGPDPFRRSPPKMPVPLERIWRRIPGATPKLAVEPSQLGGGNDTIHWGGLQN